MCADAELALLLCALQARTRVAFGQPLLDSPLTQSRIANARIALDAVHMLVLRAAQYMDRAAELVEWQRAGDRRDDAALAAAVKAARAEAASAVSAAKGAHAAHRSRHPR